VGLHHQELLRKGVEGIPQGLRDFVEEAGMGVVKEEGKDTVGEVYILDDDDTQDQEGISLVLYNQELLLEEVSFQHVELEVDSHEEGIFQAFLEAYEVGEDDGSLEELLQPFLEFPLVAYLFAQ